MNFAYVALVEAVLKHATESDLSRAGAGMISVHCYCVIIEGNYLLLDSPVWRERAAHRAMGNDI